jgi:hypothetical protein
MSGKQSRGETNRCWRNFLQAVSDLFRNALRTSLILFRIIIPISIATRFLQQWGVVDQFGMLLGPVMELVGLPGQMGLVWATAMVTNIYAGMVVFCHRCPWP